MDKPYKFTRIDAGHATVLDRATGEKIGRVEYREQRWNLRRVYVARYWVAFPIDGHKVGGYATRSDAAQALWERSRPAA